MSGMKKTVFLVRHAEAAGPDREKRYLGQLDPDLSPSGVRQAEELARALQRFPIRALFASDLRRAMRTAELIARGRDCRPEPVRELREIALGDWEGRTFAQVRARYPEEYRLRGLDLAGYRPPGGESFADLRSRVVPAFERAVERSRGDLAIVTHAGVIRMVLCHVAARPLQELFSIPSDHARVSVLVAEGGRWRVTAINAGPGGLMPGGGASDNRGRESQRRDPA